MKELSAPAERSLLHTRQISCSGWRRADGLWDVEGRLSDVRTWPLEGALGAFPRATGEPLHLMSLRLTLDNDFRVIAAEAATHQAPYADCPQINDSYGQLVGLQIQAGFTQAVRLRFRGKLGCTHLTDLIGPMATTALQTMRPILAREAARAGVPELKEGQTPPMLDSCHALRRGGTASVVRWGKVADHLQQKTNP